jgi:hypothetical protein
MICPRCKAEYVHGITVCADCGIPLVDRLPEEETTEEQNKDFREILITVNAAEIAMIKSLLDDADIDYYVKGGQFAVLRPFADPARLFVSKDQYEAALEILKDLDFGVWGDLNSKEQ